MMIKTILAGFGGQGVLMMGYSLANAAMLEGYRALIDRFFGSYSGQTRGPEDQERGASR